MMGHFLPFAAAAERRERYQVCGRAQYGIERGSEHAAGHATGHAIEHGISSHFFALVSLQRTKPNEASSPTRTFYFYRLLI